MWGPLIGPARDQIPVLKRGTLVPNGLLVNMAFEANGMLLVVIDQVTLRMFDFAMVVVTMASR